MERFAKRLMPECRCADRHFSGQEEGFVELRHFDKHFVNQGLSFHNQETFFPLVAYLLVWLNMHQYPWICLTILEKGWINCSNYCQGSEYASAPYMFDRLLKVGFWIWHGCICKVYPEFRICLIMAPYVSITPEYASVCLNVPQYGWPWLNIPECPWMYEYPWICLNKLFWLCQGSEYAAI